MDWADGLTWLLQGLGASGAVWALYSKDTSKEDPQSHRKRLTPRGWLALAGLVLGVVAFAISQLRDHKKAEAAELNRQESVRRADTAERTLAQVKESQSQLTSEQAKQLDLLRDQTTGQAKQISFLSQLALAQQQLAGIEISWPITPAMRQRIERSLRAPQPPDLAKPTGADIYFEPCILFGEIVLVRRPNYSWKLDCKLARPQGLLGLTFEVPAGDQRASTIDRFLDGLLSPSLVLQTLTGDEIVNFSTAVRPNRLERRDDEYKIFHFDSRTRLSTLKNAVVQFRMNLSQTSGLPETIRIRSLDPLVRLNQSLTTTWATRVSEVVRTQVDVADVPQEVKRYSAFSQPHRLDVSFDKLLLPPPAEAR